VAWAGQSASQGVIDVPVALAECLELPEGITVSLQPLHQVWSPPLPALGAHLPQFSAVLASIAPPPPISEGHSGCPQQRDPTFPTPIDRAQRVAS